MLERPRTRGSRTHGRITVAESPLPFSLNLLFPRQVLRIIVPGYEGVGQVAAHLFAGERKVRTPKGRVLGNAQAEQSDMSATENKPPRDDLRIGAGVRVKWWGKSPPRPRRRGWQGKHHPEQDQIGGRSERPDRLRTAKAVCEDESVTFGRGRPGQGSRVGRWKLMVT